MRTKLTPTALISDSYGDSDKATADIASGIMHDLGLISNSDLSQVMPHLT